MPTTQTQVVSAEGQTQVVSAEDQTQVVSVGEPIADGISGNRFSGYFTDCIVDDNGDNEFIAAGFGLDGK